MGFDLYGKNDGKYFRNNVWWWRPLWQYVSEICQDILSESDIKHGCYNDGHLITDIKAKTIANRIKLALDNGSAQVWADKYKEWQEGLKKEKCEICDGKGMRYDKYVQGKCNSCEGTGLRESWAKSYPFDVENLKEFEQFCRTSGGFEIC